MIPGWRHPRGELVFDQQVYRFSLSGSRIHAIIILILYYIIIARFCTKMNGRFYTSFDLQKLRGLSFASYNIRSIVRKIDDVKMLLMRSDLNVLTLSETWLNSSISNNEIEIEGYTLHRLDRGLGSPKTGGGGVMMYTKNNHLYYHMEEWNVGTPDIEILWVKLSLKLTRPTYIASIYHPPEGNVKNFLEITENKILDIQSEGPADILIMGDTNLNTLKRNDSGVTLYKQMLKRLRLTNLFNCPTRVTINSRSCIDHIITNRPDLYRNCNVIDPGLSDHQLVFVSRKKARKNKTIREIKCRNFRHFKNLAFQSDIDNIE